MTRPQGYPQGVIWDRFYDLTQIPRPSKKEEKVRSFLLDFAKQRELKSCTDEIGNVVIYLPATTGYESHETVIIQNHMDMVTDATPDRDINFETDPIVLLIESGWVTADRTTLGADNGIGCAAALAICDEKDIAHPPLELLFTVDEETGLNGAINLDAKNLSGKKMLNLDTEEWGAIYIGCAGGADYELEGRLEYTSAKPELNSYAMTIRGLKGGHSGIDIHRSRGNAITQLVQIFNEFNFPFYLSEIEGGKAHNIIPRDASCRFQMDASHVNEVEKLLEAMREKMISYLPEEDHGVEIELKQIDNVQEVLTECDQEKALLFLTTLPHGAYSYTWDVEPPCANISSNFAILKLNSSELYMQTSCRFFEENELLPVRHKIERLAQFIGGDLKIGCGYPSWKPVTNNALLEMAKGEFEQSFGFAPETKAIHAGLECGLIKEKLGEMDIISFGPNITGAHSPSESIEIESTDKFYLFFKQLLQKL